MESHDHALENRKVLTKNEGVVLSALRSAGRTLSAYEILARTARRGVRAPSQVYRALAGLAQRGLVHRIEILNSYLMCERDPHTDDAGFAVCSRCSNVDEVPLATLVPELERLAGDQEFQLHRSHVELLGLCKTCTGERAEKANAKHG
jgi:Fur family zinc uptake transcriptional regulator